MRLTNKHRIANGRSLLKLYSERKATVPLGRGESCLLIDAVADLLHYATSKGLDVESIYRVALAHYEAETIEICPKCAMAVARREALIDFGLGAEAGRTFYYCSKQCKESH
jgi:hypothetical protein